MRGLLAAEKRWPLKDARWTSLRARHGWEDELRLASELSAAGPMGVPPCESNDEVRRELCWPVNFLMHKLHNTTVLRLAHRMIDGNTGCFRYAVRA